MRVILVKAQKNAAIRQINKRCAGRIGLLILIKERRGEYSEEKSSMVAQFRLIFRGMATIQDS